MDSEGIASRAQSPVRHPIFARGYDRASRKVEARGQREHRQRLLDGLAGDVVEVGAGNGLNFPLYPPTVRRLVAVEPEAYLRDRAREAAAHASVVVEVVDGVAEALPLETASVDGAVAALVLCSVSDQEAALSELRRVIRPGGALHFYEHVRALEPGAARRQDIFNLVWPRLAGGCHPNRDTVGAIERAGFRIERLDRLAFKPFPFAFPTAPHVLGVARR
jgi:ubiquinone/menaquinone biosynthesis C-methylase UbiE